MGAGDKVLLKVSIGSFGPGSKGIVDSVLNSGLVNVSVTEDENGTKVTPPAPLPLSEQSKFEVI